MGWNKRCPKVVARRGRCLVAPSALVRVRLYGTKVLATDDWDHVVNYAIDSPSNAYTTSLHP